MNCLSKMFMNLSKSKLLKIAISLFLVLMLIPAAGLKGHFTGVALAETQEESASEDPQDLATEEEVVPADLAQEPAQESTQESEAAQEVQPELLAAPAITQLPEVAGPNAPVVVSVDLKDGEVVGTLPTGWSVSGGIAKKTFESGVKGEQIQNEWKDQKCVTKSITYWASTEQEATLDYCFSGLTIDPSTTITTDTSTDFIWSAKGLLKSFTPGVSYEGAGERYETAEYVSIKFTATTISDLKYEATLGTGEVVTGTIKAKMTPSPGLDTFSGWNVEWVDAKEKLCRYVQMSVGSSLEIGAEHALIYNDRLCRVLTDVGPHGTVQDKIYNYAGSKISLDSNNNLHFTFDRYGLEQWVRDVEFTVNPDEGYQAEWVGDIPSTLTEELELKLRFRGSNAILNASVAQGQSQMGKVAVSGATTFPISDNLTWKYDNGNVVISNNGVDTTVTATSLDPQLYEFDKWEVKYYDGGQIQPGKVTEDLYVIAHFKLKQYKATFKLDGGTLTADQKNTLTSKGWKESANGWEKSFDSGTGFESIKSDWNGITPSKEHYVFANWDGPKVLTADSEYVATYNPAEYTIDIEAELLYGENAGTIALSGSNKVVYLDNQYSVNGDTITIFKGDGTTKTATVKGYPNDGYIFKAWKVNGVEKASGSKGSFDCDTILTAVFDFAKIQITFNPYYQSGAEQSGGIKYDKSTSETSITVDVFAGSLYKVSGTDDEPYTITFSREHCNDIVVSIDIYSAKQNQFAGFWRDAKGNVLYKGTEGAIADSKSFTATFYDYVNTYSVTAVAAYSTKGSVSINPDPTVMKNQAKWVKSEWSETGDNTLTITDAFDHSSTITAKAKQGYSFICWAVDDTYLDGDEGVISGATKFVAYFAQVKTINVSLKDASVGAVDPTSFRCPISSEVQCMYDDTDNTLHVYLEDGGKRFWEQVVTTSVKESEVFDKFEMNGTKMEAKTAYPLPANPSFVAFFHNAYTCTVSLNGGNPSVSGIPEGWVIDEQGNYVKTFDKGTTYTSIQDEWSGDYAPVKEGHTFNKWVVEQSGTTITEPTNMSIDWTTNTYNLIVKGHFELETEVYTKTIRTKFGESYSYDVPTFTGYTSDITKIEGTMPAKDVTVDIYYTLNTHKLTINYVCPESSETVAQSYTADVKYGIHYKVESPTVKGYTVKSSQAIIEGDMVDEDVTIDVEYSVVKYKMSFAVSQPQAATEKFGEVSAKELDVWYGTKYSVDGNTVTFTFPDNYPGEKVQTVQASQMNHGVFINWTTEDEQLNDSEVYKDMDFSANFEEGYLVKGKVIDADSADPIPDATVYFVYHNTKLKDSIIYAVTDENGVYSLPAILKTDIDTNAVDATVVPTKGAVYCVAPGYEAGVFDQVEVYRDCSEDEYVSTIELKVYSGTFVMQESEGGNGITIDYKSSSKIEKHGTYTEPIKVGACQGEDVTCSWQLDGDKVLVEYVDTSAPQKYVDNTTFTAQPKDGYVFDSWSVDVVEPQPEAQANEATQQTSGKVYVDTTYTFKANYKYVGGTDSGEASKSGATSDNNFVLLTIAMLTLIVSAATFAFSRKRKSNTI